jgi:hypothetical protein
MHSSKTNVGECQGRPVVAWEPEERKGRKDAQKIKSLAKMTLTRQMKKVTKENKNLYGEVEGNQVAQFE